MVIGNESGGNNKSFDSTNSHNPVLQPTLEITYEESVLPGIVEGRKWHDLDGGRYIGTGDMIITRDPDEGWVNFGTYRVMIQILVMDLQLSIRLPMMWQKVLQDY